jgi:predicted ATPase
MRIAFSGAHRTGKSTLLEAVAERLPGHATVDEPYWLLAEEGHELSDPPTADDYVAQLERSLALLADAGPDTLLDRCPADFIAYLRAIGADDEADEWLDRAREATDTLDLVVLVLIETPDRVAVSTSEDRGLRRHVDEALQLLLLEDGLGADVAVLDVHGSVEARAQQVLAAMR